MLSNAFIAYISDIDVSSFPDLSPFFPALSKKAVAIFSASSKEKTSSPVSSLETSSYPFFYTILPLQKFIILARNDRK
jgi:hypothetical protein